MGTSPLTDADGTAVPQEGNPARARGRRLRWAVGLFALAIVVAGIGLGPQWGRQGTAAPAALLNEPFTGTSLGSPTNWVNTAVSGWPTRTPTSDYSCLTAATTSQQQTLATGIIKGCAGTAIDSSGSGALRLTPASNSYSSFFLYNSPLSTRDGLDITFNQAQYGGNGADGISFFLQNGANTSTAAGGSGEALGYSRWCSAPGSGDGSTGVAGGIIGIGFDVYGAFDCNAGTGGNYLSIKGADTSAGQNGTAGYATLAATSLSSTTGSLTSGTNSRAGRARSVRIFVDPATATTPTVKVWIGSLGQTWNPLTDTPTLQANMPTQYLSASTFKFGFAAGTGGQNDIHEVYGLSISAAQDPTYRVTYDGNGSTGGSVPVDATAYSGTGSVTVAGNTGSLVKTGYAFSGWNTAANGSGTSYASGSTMTLANADVTLYAKWVAVPAPAPPAPPAPGPAPSSAEPEPSGSSAPPVPAPSPSASPELVIIQNQDNGSVPAGAGVAPGGALLLVGGVPSGVRVVPDRSVSPTGVDASGDGFTMRLRGLGADGRPLGLTGDGALLLESGRSAGVSGTGFRPNAPVKVFLFVPARELGTVMTDASGSFSGRVPLPADLPPGRYTLQTNGWTPNGQVRSLSLGVQARAAQSRKFGSASTVVFFPELSAELTDTAKATLRGLVKGRAGRTVRTVVVGFVQGDQRTDNNKYLSTMRAVAISRYLKSLGVTGLVTTSGAGIAEQSGPAGRRASVTIRYTK